jgi:hypothetical protein
MRCWLGLRKLKVVNGPIPKSLRCFLATSINFASPNGRAISQTRAQLGL